MKVLKKLTVLFVLLIVLFSVASCGTNKDIEPVTAAEFTEIMEDAGLYIEEFTGDFEDSDGVEVAILASTDDYAFEFYIVETVEQAKRAYTSNKDYFENDLSSAGTSSNKEINVANYSRYTTNKDGVFAVISRIENTFIYAKVGEKYKDEVVELLKKLGYL